jgi:uncharacterized protein (TIGR02145 family)
MAVPTHKIYSYIIFFLSFTSFSQSKKEQIEILTIRVDSLNRVIGNERSSNQNKINELNSGVTKLESQITGLSSKLTTLNRELQDSKEDILKKQKEIVENQIVISKLQSELKIKSDSLEIVKKEQSSQSYLVTQTDPNKSVKIGTQTWMAENLNVSTFRNGDPILQAKTDEEWKKAGENKQPAWCYYDNDPANGEKYGKLYNWYAVNDPRGLAPQGWHIPSKTELTELKSNGATVEGMKSKSGWNDYNGRSGNGTNESGFSGLPGGWRSINGYFDFVGNHGYWWSSSEGAKYNACYHILDSSGAFVLVDVQFNPVGMSVRCLKD